MSTRRSLLRKVGLTGVGAGAGVALLPSPPDVLEQPGTVEGAESPEADLEWLDETIADEDDAPVARYQYEPDGDGFAPTAPINVAFLPAEDVADGLERVMSVLEDRGWVRNPEEYTRFARDRERDVYVRQEATAAQSYYGTSGRRHVRCWSFEGVVSMQAHEDTGARPTHGIASYRRARAAIAAIFDDAGWRVVPEAIDLANEQGDHDGRATLVTEDA